MNFQEINEQLRAHIGTIVADICPGGATSGQEYVAAGINGGKGRSFSVNLNTGKWADFATSDRGGDIISLYARARGINNGEAAKELVEKYAGKRPSYSYPVQKPIAQPGIIKPPSNAAAPSFTDAKLGDPTGVWTYRDIDGDPMFYVARYDHSGEKTFRPYSFTSAGKWAVKAWPKPRPLYNLDKIYQNQDKPILVVEGEKSAEAAAKLTTAYVITTWPNGVNSVNLADFSPIYGRNVLLWPDGDDAGRACMETLARNLADKCTCVKVIDPDRNSGFDAADAILDPHFQFTSWAKPLVRTVPKSAQPVVEDPDVQTVPDSCIAIYTMAGLEMTKNGTQVILNSANVVKLLEYLPEYKGKFWYDSFYDREFFDGKPASDHDYLSILIALQSKYGLSKLVKQHVIDAIDFMFNNNIRSEPAEWMRSLSWDGTPRIAQFFTVAMGAEKNEYTEAVGRNFFTAMAARVLSPGCKFDNMVILEGPQGTYKSTSLRLLAGDKWFAENSISLESKDFEQSLAGKMIIEFAEMASISKAEDNLLKKKLSCQIDTYRASYARKTKDYPRTCVLVSTTNDYHYINDPTGARRYWPIRVKVCDIEYIKQNREQLFAEAVARYMAGENWHEMPAMTTDVQNSRRVELPWMSIISDYFNANPHIHSMRTIDIYTTVIMGTPEKFTKRESNSIGSVMKLLGFEYTHSRLGDNLGDRYKAWTKPVTAPKIIKNHAPVT